MVILRLGLYVAVGGAAVATWASMHAGYPVETAMLRGIVAFMALSFVAYAGALIVMTAPPADGAPREAVAVAESEGGGDERNAPDAGAEVLSLPAARAEREAAADRRQAA